MLLQFQLCKSLECFLPSHCSFSCCYYCSQPYSCCQLTTFLFPFLVQTVCNNDAAKVHSPIRLIATVFLHWLACCCWHCITVQQQLLTILLPLCRTTSCCHCPLLCCCSSCGQSAASYCWFLLLQFQSVLPAPHFPIAETTVYACYHHYCQSIIA